MPQFLCLISEENCSTKRATQTDVPLQTCVTDAPLSRGTTEKAALELYSRAPHSVLSHVIPLMSDSRLDRETFCH